MTAEPEPTPPPARSVRGMPGDRPAQRFAHASEAELARILDFYGVEWRYEPDTFPIGWNLDGDVVESFSPDFYLPELDLYVELTTLKQKLVRKKNRKLRRLRELYPDIRIKLFYARDFRMLLLKFGRMALVDELTGTTGQATPPRAAASPASPPRAAASPASPPEAVVAGAGVVAGHGDAGEPVAGLVSEEPGAAGVPGEAVRQRMVPPAEQRGRRRGRRRRRTGDPAHAATGAMADEASARDGIP